MFPDSGYGYLTAARCAELLDKRSTWNRRLWEFGTFSQLFELLESADPRTSAGARSRALDAARTAVLNDLALGDERRSLLRFLPKHKDIERFTKDGHTWRVLQHEVSRLQAGYLDLWLDLLDSPSHGTPDVNESAVALTSHLLGLGFSDAWVVNYFNYAVKRQTSPTTLADLLRSAKTIHANGTGPYTFLIPLQKRARLDSRTGRPWLSATDFAAEFAKLFPHTEIPPNAGGLLLSVQAYDKYAATSWATQHLAELDLRVHLSSVRRQLVHDGMAWMHPGASLVDLRPQQAGTFRVSSLDDEGGRLLLAPMSAEIEAAFDLLAAFTTGRERAACVAAWAAIESLFAGPSDFGQLAQVANRAASILTCLWIRDTMVSLATKHASSSSADDPLAEALRSAPDPVKVSLLATHLASGGTINAGARNSAVALPPVRRIVQDRQAIRRLRDTFTEALTRLYRSRNQIVHSGALRPYGFGMTLRASQVLLSALLDSVIANDRRTGEPAGMLAARAEWSVERLIEGADFTVLATL